MPASTAAIAIARPVILSAAVPLTTSVMTCTNSVALRVGISGQLVALSA
jgi:hypothetical protein